MWVRPTSQSLFFSTLLGRVQFRDTSFVDQRKQYRLQLGDLLIFLIAREKNKNPQSQVSTY